MITEKAKNEVGRQKIENGIRICEEALEKSEKYERLNENKDWKGYLEDLKILESLHDKEIQMGVMLMVDAPNHGYMKKELEKETYVSGKQDWTDFIIRHQIQKAELSNWIKEPERILAMASLAREKLPVLKKKLEELENVPVDSQP